MDVEVRVVSNYSKMSDGPSLQGRLARQLTQYSDNPSKTSWLNSVTLIDPLASEPSDVVPIQAIETSKS